MELFDLQLQWNAANEDVCPRTHLSNKEVVVSKYNRWHRRTFQCLTTKISNSLLMHSAAR